MLPALYVPEASQWLSTSAGRESLDGYSWMQAVHWVAGSGLYEPRRYRSHGPRSFGPTTIRVAQELAQLFPCRPGIAYLVRRTGLSERSVEYHLGMLREAGLLAYVVRGTRVRGEIARASEFARMIPVAFDAALGIRTSGEGSQRRMTGIAEAGRELMARLAKRAARKVRKPRAKSSSKAPSKGSRKGANGASVTAGSAGSRCTPMEGGSASSSPAGTTSFPPESKLASGKPSCPTPKKSNGGGRQLTSVGRRFQLAAELIRRVPWMHRASVPRIAWIVREVADAGWTAEEVIAWLDCGDAPGQVHRPSGFLAQRLKSAVALWPHAEGRARAVEAARDSRRAEKARHAEWEGVWRAPRSESVRRLVAEAFAPKWQQHDQHEALPALDGLEGLSEQEMAAMRAEAQGRFMSGDTSLIKVAVDSMGRASAERIYGADLVQRALKLASGSSLMALGRR
ncbi:helix-turn-helix domain-containing protein [Streptomyces sp. NPDC002668]|uniref:helix-turn-helix domain-containing protein n=1 Tax=Streptomyces sp. NPDC002668 TaxID=3154422 RepID=UPI0033180E05